MKFKSSELRIYPAANRNASYDYFANLNVEQNITMLSNNLTDYHSYVVNGLDLQVEDIKENSETKKYLTLTSGKCVINGYNIEIKAAENIKIQELDTSSDYAYNVYLKLNCVESAVSQGNTMTQLVGYDDENTELYTGIDILVVDAHTDLPDNILYLGTVTHTGSLWYIQPLSKEKKFSANNTYIELPFDSGLVGNSNNTDFKGTFINWLENNFIIDDDDISSSQTVSSPAIKIEYLDGSSIQLDVQKLHFGTTLTADMVPNISQVKSIYIPTYFTSITEGALNGASNLTNLTLPFIGSTVTTAEGSRQSLFGYIFGTTEYDNSTPVSQTPSSDTIINYIPSSLRTVNLLSGFLHSNCFENCSMLTEISMKSSVASHTGNYVFKNCSNLSYIHLPSEIYILGAGGDIFTNCNSLTNISFRPNPSNTTGFRFIDGDLYVTVNEPIDNINCRWKDEGYLGIIKRVIWPDDTSNITAIAQMFWYCSLLKEIEIPAAVNSIDVRCFYGTPLEKVTCLPTTPPTLGAEVFHPTTNLNIYVPSASESSYKTAPRWSDYADKIQSIPE